MPKLEEIEKIWNKVGGDYPEIVEDIAYEYMDKLLAVAKAAKGLFVIPSADGWLEKFEKCDTPLHLLIKALEELEKEDAIPLLFKLIESRIDKTAKEMEKFYKEE